MKKNEALLLSAFTGFLLVKDFYEVHEFIQKTLERPVFTHEMASDKFNEDLRDKLLPQILELIDNMENNNE